MLLGVVNAAAICLLPQARPAFGQSAGGARPAPPSSRRDVLAGAAVSSHFPFGPVVPPELLPNWLLRTHESKTVNSSDLLQGHVTALQLMFTGCSATCPIQGAVFAAAQRKLGTLPGTQFLSVSIDPATDNPAALNDWLQRFGARPGWIAAAPRSADLTQIRALLRGAGGGEGTQPRPTDAHSAQVYLIDRQMRLVHRSADFPPAEQIVENLRRLSVVA